MGNTEQEVFVLREVKLFHSKYTEEPNRSKWYRIIRNLNYDVKEKIEDHDVAIVLGGFWENPNVFNNPVVFIMDTSDGHFLFDFYLKILCEYYDNIVDLTGLSMVEAARKINDEVDKLRS